MKVSFVKIGSIKENNENCGSKKDIPDIMFAYLKC